MSSQSWISADTPSIAGSSILKQSPPFPSHSESTGPRGADLSLSELYTSDREDANSDVPRPFSLLPQRRDKHEGGPVFSDSERRLAEEEDAIGLTKGKGSVHETRQDEERLQRDLFVLKKLNASLELYDTALKNAKSCTEVGNLMHVSAYITFVCRLLLYNLTEQTNYSINMSAFCNKRRKILSLFLTKHGKGVHR